MKKILLIDDSDFYLETAEFILKDNFEITTARSGKEALGYLSKGLVPNLILLDVIMPEMDGWEVFNLIKGISLLREVPIAFFSSLDAEADKNNAAMMGAVDFITKPFTDVELLQRVDSILEKYGKGN